MRYARATRCPRILYGHERVRVIKVRLLTSHLHVLRMLIFPHRRTGIVTTSIVGIFKEVATITLSSWIFGDVLTPLKVCLILSTPINADFFVALRSQITGAGVTICGIALYSWHKYSKTVLSAEEAAAQAAARTSESDEGYALVRGDDDVFALGDSDDDDAPRRPAGSSSRAAKGRAVDDEDRWDEEQRTDAGDSLLERRDGDEDARSVRTVASVRTVGSVARKWRDV